MAKPKKPTIKTDLELLIREYGVNKMAAATGLAKTTVIATTTRDGDPRLSTLEAILAQTGYRLAIVPAT